MNTSVTIKAPWLDEPYLQTLLAVLNADGEEARIAGGAVRNAILGEPVADIDIATTNLPDATVHRAEAVGFKTVPTGAEHGTITVIADGRPVEVTTLRADVETDGRHARVVFGRDWRVDAERRDFTIDALYAEADGTVIDLVDGIADLDRRVLRFIGDAETRIHEDYLRILRFFRFFAWYGSGRPDPNGLKACARLKDGIVRLPAERIWSELKKQLSAPDPSRSLLWMRQAGVLTSVLPETEKWGIDAIHDLVRAEADLGWPADPLLRLSSIVPLDAARMKTLGDRLKLSNAEINRLVQWATTLKVESKITEGELSKCLYRGNLQGYLDRLSLDLAVARGRAYRNDKAPVEASGYFRLLSHAQKWRKPQFPLHGGDVAPLGVEGPKLGVLLKALETEWVDSGFSLESEALLKRAADILNNQA